MVSISLPRRMALSDKLRGLKQVIAEVVTEDFFQRHPDWLAHYGERGRKHGIEDACFHIEFLAGAVECGIFTPFEDYARWTVRMLAARQIPAHFVVENLTQIERALGERFSGPELLLIVSFIRAGCAACIAPVEQLVASQSETGIRLGQRLFLQAILKGQRKAALTIVSELLREGFPVLDVYLEVFQESLYQVGKLWESNVITVAEEHMATAITQFVLGQTYSQLPPPGDRRGNVILTGVAGELHQVGANMVADVLESQGFDVRFLGTNMPHTGIVQEIEKHRADVLGISTTMLFNVPAAIRLIEDVRAKLGASSPRIVLGGAAFHTLPTLGAEMGTLGVAKDIREAVSLLSGQ